MTKYSNTTQVPISLAVWLAHDTYDHNPDKKTISATSLIKPLKQLILEQRVTIDDAVSDISSMIASSMGTAIHDSIESSWLDHPEDALKSLGYPESVWGNIMINPKMKDLISHQEAGMKPIPIYMEQRSHKDIAGYTISGKYDFVIEGRVEDFKTTSTYTYINKSNDEKYKLQGSIYKWLNQDIITEDTLAIQFIFTDWSAIKAKTDPKYPNSKILEYILPIMSVEETERYILNRLRDLDKYISADESDIPACSDEDLWRRPTVWKYYKNPASRTRSTKNFTNSMDANDRLATDGSVGTVVKVTGEVVACRYCPALNVCKQKDNYLANGDLKI